MPVPTDPDPAPPQRCPDDLKSRLRLHQQFASKLVDEKHDFIVYLPPMYDAQPDRRFPVLFMQDGQNLFDPEHLVHPRATTGAWAKPPTQLIGTGEIEPLMIVGIYNTGEHRIDEYTPVEDKRLGGGQADAYGQMLVEELKPFVDHQYRTLPGAENCGMGGSSLGGLVTLYLGLRYTWVFSKLCVMSPSVWWRQPRDPEDSGADQAQAGAQASGSTSARTRASGAAGCSRAERRAGGKGWVIGQDLAYSEIPGAHHDEAAWSERVGPMLKFLFPPK